MIQRIIVFFFVLGLSIPAYSQFGYGLTGSLDLYQRYSNPSDNIASPSAGNVLLNIGVGPKIWIGGKKFSVSAESQALVGLTAFSISDYKGMGSLAFPIIGNLNFKGMSGFNREGTTGLSLGGGIQYNKTELYGLKSEFAEKGVTRDYFKTYVVQAGYGFGINGFGLQLFTRYGFNPDIKSAKSLNIGFQFDFNIPALKKISTPESSL